MISIKVLSCASVDSSPSLLITGQDGSATLVNCGEGCQRSFLESKGASLKKLSRVCVTQLEHAGGLPGMILTSSDIALSAWESINGSTGTPETMLDGLTVMGPPGTGAFMNSLRNFVKRSRFPVQVHEGEYTCPCGVGEAGTNQKKKKKQKAPIETNPFEIGITTLVANYAWERTLCKLDESRKRSHDQLTEGPRLAACSFKFTTPPILGKFLVDHAKELGVPHGPLYGKLKAGQSVSWEVDGVSKTVHSHEVVSPGCAGVAIWVLTCPALEIVDQLSSSPYLAPFLRDRNANPEPQLEHELDLVVHITTRAIFLSDAYQAFKRQFHSSVQHLIMPTDSDNPSPFVSATRGAALRHLIHADIYANPHNDSERAIMEEDLQSLVEANVRLATPGLEYIVVPRTKKGWVEPLLPKTTINLMEEATKSGALSLAQSIESKEPKPQKCPRLVFTGTGSAVPCKHRNVTGIYLETTEQGDAMMLDIGEGTVGQLYRINYSLQSIKLVWISHPHADHHLGLVRLLAERKPLDDDDYVVVVIGPHSLGIFLDEYAAIDARIVNKFVFIDIRATVPSQLLQRPFTLNGFKHVVLTRILSRLGINNLSSIPVQHCMDSFAVVVDTAGPFGRVVYSGDGRPSYQALVRAGMDANVLIHEATFETNLAEEAVLKQIGRASCRERV